MVFWHSCKWCSNPYDLLQLGSKSLPCTINITYSSQPFLYTIPDARQSAGITMHREEKLGRMLVEKKTGWQTLKYNKTLNGRLTLCIIWTRPSDLTISDVLSGYNHPLSFLFNSLPLTGTRYRRQSGVTRIGLVAPLGGLDCFNTIWGIKKTHTCKFSCFSSKSPKHGWGNLFLNSSISEFASVNFLWV